MSDDLELPKPLSEEEKLARLRVIAGMSKHLVGLDAAGIGLMAFFGDRFAGQGWQSDVMLAGVMMLLLISLFAAVSLFWLTTMAGHESTRPGEMHAPGLMSVSFVCGLGGFAMAMTLLAALSVLGLMETIF